MNRESWAYLRQTYDGLYQFGLVGGLFGILAGLGLQAVMVQSSEFISGANADQVIPWGVIGMALAVAALAAPAVGLLPARWASRMDVVEALRFE